MIYIIAAVLFICFAFITGYLLFSYIRKKSDKERDENNSNLKYVEDLKQNVLRKFDVLIAVLSPSFDSEMPTFHSVKRSIEEVPFVEIQKNYSKQEQLQKINQQLNEFDEYINNIGIEYVSKETVLSLIKKLKF
jgi:hypothetical protein